MSESWVGTQAVQNVSSIKCELPVQFVTKFKINNVVSTHTVVVFELKVRTCQIQLGLDQEQGASHSLSLLIVTWYSTVVVQVVEVIVVVVVLEVVSASSQQRLVSQSIQLFNISHFLWLTQRPTVAALQFHYEPLRFDSFCLWGCFDIKNKLVKMYKKKMSNIHLLTTKKIHIHTTRPSWYQDQPAICRGYVWLHRSRGWIQPDLCLCVEGFTLREHKIVLHSHSPQPNPSIHPSIHSSSQPSLSP